MMDGRVKADNRTRRALLASAVIGVAALLTGCGPEANRSRGGNRGADVGNRDKTVQLLGDRSRDSRIFYGIPEK